MNHEQAHRVFTAVMASRETELRNDLLRLAVRYFHIRAEWWLARTSSQPTDENLRSRCHDALIDACSILSRAMMRAGEGNDWRADLGEDRKVIGDFACHALLPGTDGPVGAGARQGGRRWMRPWSDSVPETGSTS